MGDLLADCPFIQKHDSIDNCKFLMSIIDCSRNESENQPVVAILGAFDSSFLFMLSKYAEVQPIDSSCGTMPDLYVVSLTDRVLEFAEVCRRIEQSFPSARFLYITDLQTFRRYRNQIGRCPTPNCLLTTSVNQFLPKAITEVSNGLPFFDPDITDF